MAIDGFQRTGGGPVRSTTVLAARQDPTPAADAGEVLTIDCASCELEGTSACGDCLVSFVCDRPAGGAVVIDVAEARAIRLLGRGGLLPESRHRRRTG